MEHILFCSELAKIPNIKHGFLTRKIKDSNQLYFNREKLKANSNLITNNKKIIANAFNSEQGEIAFLQQVHSNKVAIVTKSWKNGEEPDADAMVTKQKNILLAIQTADCVPLLFTTKDGLIIGAAHSGWKGAIGGIIENTIKSMQDLGARPEEIIVCLGPCIKQPSYEVSLEFYEKFLSETSENKRFFINSVNEQHYMFDLPAYVKNKLAKNGIKFIHDIALDTYQDAEKFFSYRRSVKTNDPSQMGSLISLIALQ